MEAIRTRITAATLIAALAALVSLPVQAGHCPGDESAHESQSQPQAKQMNADRDKGFVLKLGGS